jgi:hypothetical protein
LAVLSPGQWQNVALALSVLGVDEEEAEEVAHKHARRPAELGLDEIQGEEGKLEAPAAGAEKKENGATAVVGDGQLKAEKKPSSQHREGTGHRRLPPFSADEEGSAAHIHSTRHSTERIG